jgi:hypothetical protein
MAPIETDTHHLSCLKQCLAIVYYDFSWPQGRGTTPWCDVVLLFFFVGLRWAGEDGEAEKRKAVFVFCGKGVVEGSGTHGGVK